MGLGEPLKHVLRLLQDSMRYKNVVAKPWLDRNGRTRLDVTNSQVIVSVRVIVIVVRRILY